MSGDRGLQNDVKVVPAGTFTWRSLLVVFIACLIVGYVMMEFGKLKEKQGEYARTIEIQKDVFKIQTDALRNACDVNDSTFYLCMHNKIP